jgi:hypothetical protein
MLRKLILSIVGAFFSSKSVMVIGTALLISVFFQILHSLYYPFKSKKYNRMQQICLTVLNLFYMSGLLLKTAAVTSEDSDDIGLFLVTLLVLALVAVLAGILLTLTELMAALQQTMILAKILRGEWDPSVASAQSVLDSYIVWLVLTCCCHFVHLEPNLQYCRKTTRKT